MKKFKMIVAVFLAVAMVFAFALSVGAASCSCSWSSEWGSAYAGAQIYVSGSCVADDYESMQYYAYAYASATIPAAPYMLSTYWGDQDYDNHNWYNNFSGTGPA